MSPPFTFGIALVPRVTAGDWELVQALLGLTLRSALRQTDPDFRILIAGHDRPVSIPDDSRIDFVRVDWPVCPPGPHNEDSGHKKHLLNQLVLDQGGGDLMLLDADDWVDRRTVEAARACIGERIGGIVISGWAVDIQSRRAAQLPDSRIFDGEYHRLCGSSTVARLRPEEEDPLRRDPFSILRSHHQWIEAARAHGAELARLPVEGAYLINTTENHSDLHGPHGDWRRGFTRAVDRFGTRLDASLAAKFGLGLDEVLPVSRMASAWARGKTAAVTAG